MSENLFDPGQPSAEEQVEVLLTREHLRVERIISWAHQTPEDFWYDQEDDEWLVLLSGSASLRYKDEIIHLNQGAPHLIPAHKRHQVAATSEPAIWLCLFCESENS